MYNMPIPTPTLSKLTTSSSLRETIVDSFTMRIAMETLKLTTSFILRAIKLEQSSLCCSSMYNANTNSTTMATKNKNKKLTIKYWCSLSRSSRERALKYCYPIHPSIVSLLLDERPTTREVKNGFWSVVFRKITIPADNKFYKTCFMNETYLA